MAANFSMVNLTKIEQDIETAKINEFNAKCKGPPPSLSEVVMSMSYLDLTIHIISIIMMFITIFLFFDLISFLHSNMKKNYRRRRMTIILAGISPVFTTAAVVGTFFPRGHLMIDFVCSVYFGFAMHAFLNLVANYYGGVTMMVQRLKGEIISLNTPPCCCCLICLPGLPMTRKLYHIFYYVTFQAALSRPLILFFRGVFMLDRTISINDMIFVFILLISMFIGLWALVVFLKFSRTILKPYKISGKFFAFQFVILVLNLQPLVIKIISLPCVPPYTTAGRILTVNYQIAVLEFFLLSLITRILYRSKIDGMELDEIVPNDKKSEISNSRNDNQDEMVANESSNAQVKLLEDSAV